MSLRRCWRKELAGIEERDGNKTDRFEDSNILAVCDGDDDKCCWNTIPQ